MEQSNTKILYIIVNAGFSAEVMDVAREAGARGATIINARGEGVAHKSVMGITLDSEKEILMLLMEADTAASVMAAVKEKAGIHSPSQSICFTVNVERNTLINNFPAPDAQE